MSEEFSPIAEMLRQARRINFALITASILILTTFAVPPDKSATSAQREFQMIQGLTGFWNAKIESIVDDEISALSLIEASDINYSEALLDVSTITYSSTTQEKHDNGQIDLDKFECEFKKIVVPSALVQLQNGALLDLKASSYGDNQFFSERQSRKSSDRQYGSRSYDLGKIETLGEFIAVWNTLSYSVSIVSPQHIAKQSSVGIVTEYDEADDISSIQYIPATIPNTGLQQYDRSSARNNTDLSVPLRGGIWQASEYARNAFEWNESEEETDITNAFYAQLESYDYIVVAQCELERNPCTDHAENFFDIEIPIGLTTSIRPINLSAHWIKSATKSDFLVALVDPNVRGTFGEYFKTLNNFVSQRGDLTLTQLDSALETAVQNEIQEQAKEISFLGLNVNSKLIRYVGIFSLVFLQLYLHMHVKQALITLRSGVEDDQAAYLPWAALYDGNLARSMFLISTCWLPPASGLALLVWSFNTGSGIVFLLFLAVPAVIGLAFSTILSLRLARVTKELNHEFGLLGKR